MHGWNSTLAASFKQLQKKIPTSTVTDNEGKGSNAIEKSDLWMDLDNLSKVVFALCMQFKVKGKIDLF